MNKNQFTNIGKLNCSKNLQRLLKLYWTGVFVAWQQLRYVPACPSAESAVWY